MVDPVQRANRASAGAIARRIGHALPDIPLALAGDSRWRLQIECADDLRSRLKKQCVEIFEANMKQIYLRSASGYNPAEKRRELFDPDSRFMLVSSADDGRGEQATLAGFLMWRFDREECLGGVVEVAYCYEIQLRPATRGKGLGKVLMEMLERIAASWGMKKVMLTVHIENQKAFSFYRSLNFSPDEISPSQTEQEEGEPDAGYEILSKPVGSHHRASPSPT